MGSGNGVLRPGFSAPQKSLAFAEGEGPLSGFTLYYPLLTLYQAAALMDRAVALQKKADAGAPFEEQTRDLVAMIASTFSGWAGYTPAVLRELAGAFYSAEAQVRDEAALTAAGQSQFGYDRENVEQLCLHSRGTFWPRIMEALKSISEEALREGQARKKESSSGLSTERPGEGSPTTSTPSNTP